MAATDRRGAARALQIGLPFDQPVTGARPSDPHASGTPSPHESRVPRESRIPHPESLLLVRHSRARRYVLRVRDDGSVRVTIPRWGSKRGAMAFADRERAWIERERTRVAVRQATRAALSPADRSDAHARARRELPARLLELAARHGLVVTRISIRNQRSRWGSCSPGGRICLNWRLVLMPDWVRDYVLVHELMHLRRMDHSPRFWKLVAKACPGYRAARRWLREHADLLG